VREDGLPLRGAMHHLRFIRAGRAFSPEDCGRAGPPARHPGLTVELADER
jgi:hypothetical protein